MTTCARSYEYEHNGSRGQINEAYQRFLVDLSASCMNAHIQNLYLHLFKLVGNS